MIKQKERIEFDIMNPDHIEDVRYFFQNNRWKNGCQYKLEYPFLTIPDMIKTKLTHYALS